MPYKDKTRNRDYQRKWIERKKDVNPAFAATVAARRRRDLELRLAFIGSIKADLGCFYCPEDDPVLLDFHHIDETTKVLSVSKMVRGRYAIPLIVDEIAKCLCVCRNHHAHLTQLRCDFANSRKRRGLSRVLVEHKRREASLLTAKRFLKANHPNSTCQGNVPKMLRYVFGL